MDGLRSLMIIPLILGAYGAYVYGPQFLNAPQVTPELVPKPATEPEAPKKLMLKQQVYQWVDEHGVQQFSAQPPQNLQTESKQITVSTVAQPKDPVLMHSKGFVAEDFSKPSPNVHKISSVGKKSSGSSSDSYCRSAKDQLSNARRERYTAATRASHRAKVERYEQRVNSACN